MYPVGKCGPPTAMGHPFAALTVTDVGDAFVTMPFLKK
jgi:hypothetical protein